MTTKNKSYQKYFIDLRDQRFYGLGGVIPPWTKNNGRSSVTVVKNATGGNLPNWRQVIASGGSATNDYVIKGRNVDPGNCIPRRYHSYKDSGGYRNERMVEAYRMPPEFPLITGFNSLLQRELLQEVNVRMYKRISEKRNPFNGFAFIGELRETYAMIRHPFETLTKLATSYSNNVAKNKAEFAARHRWARKRLNLAKTVNQRNRADKRKKALLREERRLASNLWLQYRFGVLPLIKDIDEAFHKANRIFLGNEVQFVWHKVSKKLAWDSLEWKAYETQEDDAYYRVTGRSNVRGEATLVARERVKLTMPDRKIGSIINKTFELSNYVETLIPALWDLTPMSVFMDYFVNVNDVLSSAMLNTSNVDHVELRYRESHDHSTEFTYSRPVGAGYGHFYNQPSRSTVTNYIYQRRKWGLTIPSVSFTTPIGKPIRLANLAAFLNNVV